MLLRHKDLYRSAVCAGLPAKVKKRRAIAFSHVSYCQYIIH